MCQALMEIMKEEIQDERDATQGADIKNLMETMNLSAGEAMDALRIPEDKRKVFIVNL